MSDTRTRLASWCQHGLLLGVVLAAVTAGAGVGTLELVPGPPQAPEAAPRTGTALVAAEPVRPVVREVALRGVSEKGLAALGRAPRGLRMARERLAVLSEPEAVSGYATVGLTWSPAVSLEEDDIAVSARSLKDGEWSDWTEVEYHDDHAPDPDSEEARNARPGTEPLAVGDVDRVQVRAVTRSGRAPAGMRLAVVDPGRTTVVRQEHPAIDTGALSSATLSSDDVPVEETAPGRNSSGTEAVLSGTPAAVTPRPKIFSRSQWGADESLRDRSALAYFEVHAGFVHHTVNGNDYTRKQVPAIIRSIYAYHTRSRGWSDIGYNFLVDRFGRVWEGRFGGVDRPVVGAHTYGYNSYSFAMSAIGNFDVVRPRQAVIEAYGRLMAWKLSLHGVDAGEASQRVGTGTFPAIIGHRDAGSTACPGRYLYDRLSDIRALAASQQVGFSGRDRSANLSGTPWPDLVLREAGTNRIRIARTNRTVDFRRPVGTGAALSGYDLVTTSRDLTGDRREDLLARDRTTGVAHVLPGQPGGTFGAPQNATRGFAHSDLLAGVWTFDRDRHGDVLARDSRDQGLYLYPGRGNGTFAARRLVERNFSGFDLLAGALDLDLDGTRDFVARDVSGTLWLFRGDGRGGIAERSVLAHDFGAYDLVSGMTNLGAGKTSDLVARHAGSGLMYVFPGDGRGGLRHPLGPYTGFRDADFLAATGNIDGKPGQEVLSRNRRTGQVLLHSHAGGFGVRSTVLTNLTVLDANLLMNVGDWDGNGYPDLMVRRASNGRLVMFPGTGPNRFGRPVVVIRRAGHLRMITPAGDLTGDGYPDLLAQPRQGLMKIFPSNGGTGVRKGYRAYSAIGGNRNVGVGLWDADGAPDTAVRRNGVLYLYRSNGPGGLLSGRRVGTARRYDWLLGAGDLDANGYKDLVGRDRKTGHLWLIPGGPGGFTRHKFLAESYGKYDLAG